MPKVPSRADADVSVSSSHRKKSRLSVQRSAAKAGAVGQLESSVYYQNPGSGNSAQRLPSNKQDQPYKSQELRVANAGHVSQTSGQFQQTGSQIMKTQPNLKDGEEQAGFGNIAGFRKTRGEVDEMQSINLMNSTNPRRDATSTEAMTHGRMLQGDPNATMSIAN